MRRRYLSLCCRSNNAIDVSAHHGGVIAHQNGRKLDDNNKARGKSRWGKFRKNYAALEGGDNATIQSQSAESDTIFKDLKQVHLHEKVGTLNKRRKQGHEEVSEITELQEHPEKTNQAPFHIEDPTKLQLQVETGSNVDSLTQLRFDMAVQLLHKRIMQKNKTLTQDERQLLNALIQPDPQDDETNIADIISVIESTIECFDDTSSLLPDTSFFHRTAAETPYFHCPAPETPYFHRPAPETPYFHRPASETPYFHRSAPESDVSIFSVTSGGVGIETSLHGTRRQKRQQSNEKDKISVIEKRDDPIEDNIEMSDSPYPVLGLSSDVSRPLLKVRLMEALRGFLPYAVSEENFWLKYSSSRDGNSLLRLQNSVRGSQHTLLIIQAAGEENCVFGAFTSTQWSHHNKWFGSGQSFLFKHTDKLEVYPYTGSDDLVQYCTSEMMAIGGGDWNNVSSPFSKGEKKGIGLSIDKYLAGGETFSCATFCNPRLCSKAKNDYRIEKLEIWALTPCMTEVDATKLEKHKLFVERHRQKRTI
mmetsp:Transcript_41051/g.46639  ORF Transcript_41051/g.46639 Transcript_41051/m.46639 type:complete len:533 (-) Transcript_41051:258-1856(-)